ncbi:unnamed protein product [Larinioides sclopetarius]|uniref:Uncharacterized protein n=1 Tax=Larinioides sclopetarius TaxID=280406 RepID=A0AAV1ZZQ5_9ARAC
MRDKNQVYMKKMLCKNHILYSLGLFIMIIRRVKI